MMKFINIVIDDAPNDKEEENVKMRFPQQIDVPCDVLHEQYNIKSKIPNSGNHGVNKGPWIKVQKDHPIENIIRNLNKGVVTRSKESIANSCFIFKVEPKKVKEALTY